MLRRATRFLRRHRRAIILGAVTGAVAAGVVHARRGLNRAMAALHEAENRILEEHRRQHHLARIRRECDEALLRFIASLSSSLNSHFSEETSLVHRLKALRQSGCSDSSKQQELWTELKVMAFTHFMVGYYSFNLLHMVIRIQMHTRPLSCAPVTPHLPRRGRRRTRKAALSRSQGSSCHSPATTSSATACARSRRQRRPSSQRCSLTATLKRLDCSMLALLRHMREGSTTGSRVPRSVATCELRDAAGPP